MCAFACACDFARDIESVYMNLYSDVCTCVRVDVHVLVVCVRVHMCKFG